MKDKDFLIWLHNRLYYKMYDSIKTEHIKKLQTIINNTPKNKESTNN